MKNSVEGLETKIKATLGEKTLENGQTVYEHEYIRYDIKVKNNSNYRKENIKVIGKVPEGTVFVNCYFGDYSIAEEDFYHIEEDKEVTEYNQIKQNIYSNWNDIVITQEKNLDNITVNAGNKIAVVCKVKLPNIQKENVEVQCYYGRISDIGIIGDTNIVTMDLTSSNETDKEYTYEAKIELKTGGDYGYTFRVMPKHEMLLDSANLNLVKWITKD